MHMIFWDQLWPCHQMMHSHSIIHSLILVVLYKIYQEVDNTSNVNCLTRRYHEIMSDFTSEVAFTSSRNNLSGTLDETVIHLHT